jgi:hypothetical protein
MVPHDMKAQPVTNRLAWRGQDPSLFDTEVVEISVLLPGWQATALEAMAHRHGLTTAQVIRRLIQAFTEANDEPV